jgi:hypothetical protein
MQKTPIGYFLPWVFLLWIRGFCYYFLCCFTTLQPERIAPFVCEIVALQGICVGEIEILGNGGGGIVDAPSILT